jgi:hypothetical protein
MPITSWSSLLATCPQHLICSCSPLTSLPFHSPAWIAVLVSNQVEMLLLIHWLALSDEHLMSYKIITCLLVGWMVGWLQFRCLFFTSLIIKTSSGSPKGLILLS